MPDVASLGFSVDTSQIKAANTDLASLTKSASAAERAAEKWGKATVTAGNSTAEFSRRVQTQIRALEFERAQLARNSSEREKHAALRRAGVAAASAEGRAIMASVAALQAQRTAQSGGVVGQAATTAVAGLTKVLGPLGIALSAAAVAQAAWQAAMDVGKIADQAEQVGLNTTMLQAYRATAAQAGVTNAEVDQSFVALQKSMQSANEGNDDLIAKFDKLGVKLLDVNGRLREPADIMPELARGLLSVGNTAERTALMTELLGKSGAKMRTVLEQWARGNQEVAATAEKMGAIASPAVIKAWNDFGNKLVETGERWKVFVATVGADVAIPVLETLIKALGIIFNQLAAIYHLTKTAAQAVSAVSMTALQKQIDDQKKIVDDSRRLVEASKGNVGARAQLQTDLENLKQLEDKMIQFQDTQRLKNLQNTSIVPPPPGPGAKQPVGDKAAKAGEDLAKKYQKLKDDVAQYVAQKQAETAALGQTAEAAALMTHRQDLLNKAQDAGLKMTPQLRAEIEAWAAAMAKADAQLARAKFMDDFLKKGREFIEQQQIEIDVLFMSTEAAMAYRLEIEAINRAKREGIELTAEDIIKIRESATAQAAAARKLEQWKDLIEFGKDVARGFFQDLRNGLVEGKTLWEAFGNAALNVLNKIADKLLQLAVDQVWDLIFAGIKAGASSAAGSGGFGGHSPSVNASGGAGAVVAMGGVFDRGNVVPFASGGIVTGPTLFNLRRGTGLMGEAGPEGILPLRRTRQGRLGVEASGVAPAINIYVEADSEWVRATARDESGRVVARSSPRIVAAAVKRAGDEVVPRVEKHRREQQGDWR